jgi:phage-related protein
MNGAKAGNVIFKFLGDTKDLEDKTNGLTSKFKTAGKIIGASFVAGTAIATASVIKFTKDVTDSFSQFEQLEGGLNAMFDGNAEAIERISKTSQRAYKDLQMSQNEYLQSFESSYAIVKNGLSDNADAIEYTNKVLQLSSDLFNTYGGSTEQYSNAINWALKGTYSYLDNLNIGIKGTQEGFIEAANASGMLSREISDVNELTSDEIIDVIQHYAEVYGAWGKSANEAATTIVGSLNMTKSSWKDLINEFGKENGDIDGAFDRFMESAETFGKNLMPLIERILNNIVEHLPGIVETIGQALPGLLQTLVPTLVTASVNVLKALVEAMPQVIQVLAEMLPTIVTALISGMSQVIIALAQALPDLIPTLVDAILQLVPVILDNLPLFIEAGFQLLVGLGVGILKALPTLLSNIVTITADIINFFKELPGKLAEIGKNVLQGFWNGISNAKQWLIDKIKGLGKTILNSVKSIFGVHSPSTEFEFIGTMNMVGLKNGMEDMQPEIQKTIDSLFDLSPTLIGTMDNTLSPNIIVNNNIESYTDPLGQTVTQIKTFANGAKNDYNYGMGV